MQMQAPEGPAATGLGFQDFGGEPDVVNPTTIQQTETDAWEDDHEMDSVLLDQYLTLRRKLRNLKKVQTSPEDEVDAILEFTNQNKLRKMSTISFYENELKDVQSTSLIKSIVAGAGAMDEGMSEFYNDPSVGEHASEIFKRWVSWVPAPFVSLINIGSRYMAHRAKRPKLAEEEPKSNYVAPAVPLAAPVGETRLSLVPDPAPVVEPTPPATMDETPLLL